MTKTALTLACLTALFCYQACLVFNERCELDQRAHTYIGYTAVHLDIRPRVLRTREALIGNLTADAMLQTALDAGSDLADVALINAGAFSASTPCGPRDSLPLGILTVNDIEDLVGTSTHLVVLALHKDAFKRTLERSVASLGDALAEIEATYFLQVSGQLSFEINCDNLAHHISPDGDLRPGMRINDTRVFIGTTALADWPADLPIRVVTTKELFLGNEGHHDLQEAELVRELATMLHQSLAARIDQLSPLNTSDLVSFSAPGIDGQTGRIRPYPNCYP